MIKQKLKVNDNQQYKNIFYFYKYIFPRKKASRNTIKDMETAKKDMQKQRFFCIKTTRNMPFASLVLVCNEDAPAARLQRAFLECNPEVNYLDGMLAPVQGKSFTFTKTCLLAGRYPEISGYGSHFASRKSGYENFTFKKNSEMSGYSSPVRAIKPSH
jgi:hypothetical protein